MINLKKEKKPGMANKGTMNNKRIVWPQHENDFKYTRERKNRCK